MKIKQKLKFKYNTPFFYVYYHIDSKGDIFYIGKGRYNRAYVQRNRSDEWNKKVQSEGNYGVCFFAIGLTDKESRDLEKKLIKEGFNIGLPLVNKTFGGEGVSKKLSYEKKMEFRKNRAKKIYCYQNGKVYFGQNHVAEELGVNSTHVGYCCNNKSLQAKGYEFDYVENLKNGFGKKRPFVNNTGRHKKLKCLNNEKVYKTLKQASLDLKIDARTIKNICEGNKKSHKGLIFKYIY